MIPLHDFDFDFIRLFMGLVLFRAGGEQVFTVDEIDDIKKTVAGFRISVDPMNRIIIRVYSHDQIGGSHDPDIKTFESPT